MYDIPNWCELAISELTSFKVILARTVLLLFVDIFSVDQMILSESANKKTKLAAFVIEAAESSE